MPITIPDSYWYRNKSVETDAPFLCPYANVHKCHRYYSSVFMLGEIKMITSISDDKKEALDSFWKESKLLPVIAEDDTGICGSEREFTSFSNFCPEVSFTYFRYYASYLSKYADEIDRDCGHRIAAKENIKNDWRYEWASISACHFLDCTAYSQVHDFNSKSIGKFDDIAHPNILILIGRMEQCLDNNDPAGVLHAAASILETAAKDILGIESIQNKPFGSFIEKYKNESSLPNDILNLVDKIYKLRNVMPISGHGSTNTPTINMLDAIVISAATKFIVEIEYRAKKI